MKMRVAKIAEGRRAVRKEFKKPSLTKQAHRDECDINNIMTRFEKTQVLEHQSKYQGQYGDFLSVPEDYHEACNQVLAAQEMFLSIPSTVRDRFQNDPGRFLGWINDPKNEDEARELGFLEASRTPLEASPAPSAAPTPSSSAEDSQTPSEPPKSAD